jgi:hypothetical protein
MAGTVAHTAEEATVRELRRAALRLLFMLAALALVVVPLLGELPLGMSSQTGLLAWLLVVLGFYWLYAGLGYRPLLLAQLLCFSAAATLLSAKVLLVIVDVHSLTILRYVATGLILMGAACAVANLGGMLVSLYRRTRGVADEQ